MVNSHLVCDPTIWQPGFDLSRQQWSLLNHFHMEQGHLTIWFCHSACTRKWRLADTDLYPCGETQTMSDIVKSCHLTKLNGSLPGYTLQMKMLFPGWPIMGHHTHTRRRRLSPRHKSWSFMLGDVICLSVVSLLICCSRSVGHHRVAAAVAATTAVADAFFPMKNPSPPCPVKFMMAAWAWLIMASIIVP